MPNTETAGAGAKPERTPQDYAIEHAEYMAQDAERLLDTINHLNAQRDEDGDAFDSDALARAEEAVTEAFGSVRNGIYEFRKRRDRAAAQLAGAQQPGAAYAAAAAILEVIAQEPPINGSHLAQARVLMVAGRLRASHGQAPAGESLRTDALCDLSYSHGLKSGWNFCVSDDLAGFERAQKIGTEALRTLKSPTAQAAPQLPERDANAPAEQQGLFRKFDVRRVDGTDKPGGKHYGCTYFVLDVDHDPCARPALAAYAAACEATHPALADDLRTKWGAAPTTQPLAPTDAEIAALRSEFGITSNGRGIKEFTQVRDFARAVLARCTGDALDAARYRWLREHSLAAGQGSITVELDDRANGNFSRPIFLAELDAAIDAARAAQEGKSNG